jgi:hypothetical protein
MTNEPAATFDEVQALVVKGVLASTGVGRYANIGYRASERQCAICRISAQRFGTPPQVVTLAAHRQKAGFNRLGCP